MSLNTKQVPSNIVPSSTCEDSYRKYLDLRELDFKLSFPQGIVDSLQCVSAVEQRQCEVSSCLQTLTALSFDQSNKVCIMVCAVQKRLPALETI